MDKINNITIHEWFIAAGIIGFWVIISILIDRKIPDNQNKRKGIYKIFNWVVIAAFYILPEEWKTPYLIISLFILTFNLIKVSRLSTKILKQNKSADTEELSETERINLESAQVSSSFFSIILIGVILTYCYFLFFN